MKRILFLLLIPFILYGQVERSSLIYITTADKKYENFIGNEIKIVSPYISSLNVYKGNLHSHTTESDGSQSPADVMTAYKNRGYQFNSITDHNVITNNPLVDGILFIPGIESNAIGHFYYHINRIMPGTATDFNSPQEVLDTASNERSFVYINHPVDELNERDISSIRHYYGVEVWNSYYDSIKNSLSEITIDKLLTNGLRFYLMAGDDLHDTTLIKYFTAATYVFADTLNVTNIVNNLKKGNFYSSNGAQISSISVNENNKTIFISVPDTSTIRFIGKDGRVYGNYTNVLNSSYTIVGDEKYIRINVIRKADNKKAWTNPIYITSNAIVSDYTLNKSILNENKTINILPSLTSVEIQNVINIQPKNLNGYNLTFQFLDGNFTLTSTLSFNNFFGGQIIIAGNPSDNTLSTTKSVHLNFSSGNCMGISINNCYNVTIQNIKITVGDGTYFCIEAYRVHFLLVLGNYTLATAASTNRGIFTYGSLVHVQNCMFGLLGSGLMGDGSTTIYSQNNDDGGTGNQPVYGLRASRVATIGKYDATQPAGSTSNELAETGGIIR